MKKRKLRLWHISDTHTHHRLLYVPEGIDIVVFSGDCSNPKDRYLNEPQVRDFLLWFANLPIQYKVFVPGNHDTSIFYGLIPKSDFSDYGIIYLENDYIIIEGFKFFGSPETPSYSTGWAWNKARNNLDEHWSKIEDDVDVLITHGPPKTILDVSYDNVNNLEHCGCNALKRHILTRIQPKLSLFGHIHNVEDIINAGTLKLSEYPTIFSNGSVVTDNKFGVLTSNGNILTI